jgi:toxin ParE1/3/4
LIGIWTFVAENRGSAAASAFVRKIQSRFAPLLVHPELGPRRDDLAPGLRVHFHQKYALYYRYTDSEVTIVRVLHGSRDARALLVEQPDS